MYCLKCLVYFTNFCQKKKDFSKTNLLLMTWPFNLLKSLLDLWFQVKSRGETWNASSFEYVSCKYLSRNQKSKRNVIITIKNINFRVSCKSEKRKIRSKSLIFTFSKIFRKGCKRIIFTWCILKQWALQTLLFSESRKQNPAYKPNLLSNSVFTSQKMKKNNNKTEGRERRQLQRK